MNVQELYSALTDIKGSLSYFLPEISLSLGIIALVISDLFVPSFKRLNVYYVQLLLIGVVVVLYLSPLKFDSFIGTYRVTELSQFLKGALSIAVVGFNLFLVSDYYKTVSLERTSEYQLLVLTLLLSCFITISSQNLLLTVLGLETISLTSYLLVAMQESKDSKESSFKYLLFGLVSGGMLIYGTSLIFLEVESLHYKALLAFDWSNAGNWAWGGLMLFGLGLLFKLGAVPMHMWVPDVYKGASYPLISLFALLPKLVALLVLFEILQAVTWGSLVSDKIIHVLSVVALLSVTIGNVIALWQKDAKRLIAYSGIAHSGFLLIGLVALNEEAWQATVFYMLVYFVMNLGGVMILSLVQKYSGNDELSAASGLGLKYPLLGVCAVIVFSALIGLPPTVGFTAKLLVFTTLYGLVKSGDPYVVTLFVVGLINTVVGLFYYIKIPYFMFFKHSELTNVKKILGVQELFLLTICVTLLGLFIWPEGLLTLIDNII